MILPQPPVTRIEPLGSADLVVVGILNLVADDLGVPIGSFPRAGPRTGGDFGALNGWFSVITAGCGR